MRLVSGFVVLVVSSLAFGCNREGPTEGVAGRGLAPAGGPEVEAEEEILGGVYVDGSVPSSTTMWVRLVPQGSGAALLDANGNPSSSDRMPIKLQGSRSPFVTTSDGQWGWYDPEAGDGPCHPNATSTLEVHDLNLNDVPDGSEGLGIEKHCATAGAYRVELLSSQFGSVVGSREIDKVRVNGTIGSKGVEDPTLASGGPINVADVFVHFETGESSWNVSGTYTVDNASTPAVNDTTGSSADFFRFDAQHTTNWPGTNRGELMAQYDWGDLSSTRFANTDQVIRVKQYAASDTFPIRADVIHPGGSGINDQQRHVIVQNPDDAEAIGHTLPGTLTVGQWVATSVTMKNTGTNTWTTSDYKLRQWNSPAPWTPSQVSLSSPVASGVTRTLNFNMTIFEPEFANDFHNNFWRMRHDTTFFGEDVGTVTFVKPGGTILASLWTRLLAQLGPASAWARGVGAAFALKQDEEVQRIRKEDYPLDVRALESEGRAVIRYTGSLSEPWSVDFAFHLQFDPRVFRLGALVQGVKAAGYALETEIKGGEVTIRATRGPGAALQPGEGKILEIPLVLQPGAEVPETLPLVELITTR